MSLRVAMLCPYSLSVPGGVQGQVQGLARDLRTLGHQVTVLAPIDPASAAANPARASSALGNPGRANPGPATSDFVSLGRSISVRANGSVAPVALGPTASYRALAALRSSQ